MSVPPHNADDGLKQKKVSAKNLQTLALNPVKGLADPHLPSQLFWGRRAFWSQVFLRPPGRCSTR